MADISKLYYLTKPDIEEMLKKAAKYGGSPKPAFTIKKDTKLNAMHEDSLVIEIQDGAYAGKRFNALLSDVRTCLMGASKDANLVVSKYRIFLNDVPFKAKYYTNIGRIKTALLLAFGFLKKEDNVAEEPGVPYYIMDSLDNTLSEKDCKNVKIMQYDNNSKDGITVDFDVSEFYKKSKPKK